MVRKPVIWTTRAKLEKRNILNFWVYKNHSTSYSIDLNKEFKNHAELLETFHFLGKPTDFIDVRVLIVKNFSMFYKIETENIVVVGIWDNRKNPESLTF
jgi:peptidyl-tRNA hydrolase